MKQQRFFLLLLLSMMSISLIAQDGSVFSTTPSTTTTPTTTEVQKTAQGVPTARGNFMIGTGIGFSTSRSKVNSTSNAGNFDGDGGSASQLNLSPGIGYFVTNNFAFGIGMDFIASRTNARIDITDPNSQEQESINSNLLFGPFARLYLAASPDKAFFLGTTLGFGDSRDEFSTVNNEQRTINNNIITVGVGPGFTVFSRSGLALEAAVRYNYARSRSDIQVDNVSQKTVTRTHAYDFSVGLQYYFGGIRKINETVPATDAKF